MSWFDCYELCFVLFKVVVGNCFIIEEVIVKLVFKIFSVIVCKYFMVMKVEGLVLGGYMVLL